MNTFWDERYLTENYVYGREPNEFFSECLEGLIPGELLLPGEGEGRNAIYAAKKGWKVTAFDQSPVAVQKAVNWMQETGTEFHYTVNDVELFPFRKEQYDAVGLIFFHLMPSLRKYLHRMVTRTLKPGGRVIIEAFHKQQIMNQSGGPGNKDMLYDRFMIMEDFRDFRHEILEESSEILSEGMFHKGKADVLRYMGIKNQSV